MEQLPAALLARPRGASRRPACFAFFLIIFSQICHLYASEPTPLPDAGPTLAAPEQGAPRVEASLLAEVAAVGPGVPFTAAVRLRVPPGWHLSWKNPGDAGLPPRLRWELPPAISAGPIQWPTPHLDRIGPVISYALDGEVWLLVELAPAAALSQASLRLAVNAEWLACKELCIPDSARAELTLPVEEKPRPGNLAADFLAARAKLPRELGWRATLLDPGAPEPTLELANPGSPLPYTGASFFPAEPDAVDPAAPQTLEPRPGGLALKLRRPARSRAPLESLSGVLLLTGNDERDQVSVSVSTAPPGSPRAPLPFWLALICAFAGGILLNLMPCVLPVLGFKVLSLLRDASVSDRRARLGGLVYAAGVLVSFWALALALLALRASGRELGWGFQLQSPAVVSLLALLFFALALSFLGLVELGRSLQARAGAVRLSSGWTGAFLSGALATAVATPCTAPFMGAALGAALVFPPLEALAVFTALGIGMAWPYAALTLWPALLARVPKPGPWMERLQQALAFPLFATVLWLLSVLAAQAGPMRVIAALGAMLLVAFALWVLRIAAPLTAPPRQRNAARLFALILCALSAWGAAAPNRFLDAREDALHPNHSLASEALLSPPAAGLAASAGAAPEVAWLDWTPARYAQLRAEKRLVFVDFTAAWCITCQVNERLIFSSPEVLARFAALGVVPLRADWTRSDPAITRALEALGRSGVPVNLIAGPSSAEPILLPAVLTPGMVLDALDRAK